VQRGRLVGGISADDAAMAAAAAAGGVHGGLYLGLSLAFTVFDRAETASGREILLWRGQARKGCKFAPLEVQATTPRCSALLDDVQRVRAARELGGWRASRAGVPGGWTPPRDCSALCL
jgi:hypothetical protein